MRVRRRLLVAGAVVVVAGAAAAAILVRRAGEASRPSHARRPSAGTLDADATLLGLTPAR